MMMRWLRNAVWLFAIHGLVKMFLRKYI